MTCKRHAAAFLFLIQTVRVLHQTCPGRGHLLSRKLPQKRQGTAEVKKLIRLEAAKTYRLLELNFYIPIYSISWVPLTPKRMYHQAAEAIGCLVKLSERDNAVSQIYAGQDCLAPFMDDFRNAAIDILFVCPFLNKPRLKAILPILEKEIARGTLITICTRIPESYYF